MEEGAVALALVLAVLLGMVVITAAIAVRKTVVTPPTTPGREARTTGRPSRTGQVGPPPRRQQATAPSGAAATHPDLAVHCRCSATPATEILAIITNRGQSPATVRHIAVLFWPDHNGRWSWRNLPPPFIEHAPQPTALPQVLTPGQALTLPIALAPMMRFVQEQIPPGSDGFGFRVFADSGDSFDSSRIRLANVEDDCPVAPPALE